MSCDEMPPTKKKRVTNTERHFNLVQDGNLRALMRQVSHGDCDLANDRDDQGHTYLHRAVSTYKYDLSSLHYLLAQAPQLTNITANDGKTPLCLACSLTNYEIVELLLKASPEVIDLPDNDGYTPLHHLLRNEVGYRMKKNVEYLIKNGANVNSETNKNLSILRTVVKSTNMMPSFVLELLIKHGVNIGSGKNSIWNYVWDLHQVKLLLKVDSSDLNHIDEDGKTKLQRVLYSRCHEKDAVYTYLVQKGAKVGPGVDIFALVRATCKEFSAIEDLLEKHPNYDINTRDSENQTLLMQYGHKNEDLKKILARGGEIRDIFKDNETPYRIAGNEECIKTLIDAGADPLQFTVPDISIVGTMLEECSTEYNFSEYFNSFKYILNSPHIKDNTSEKKDELYRYILQTLFNAEFEFIYEEKLEQLLGCVYDANNEIVHMKFPYKLEELDRPFKWFTLTNEYMFGLFGYAIIQFLISDENFIFESRFYVFLCFVRKILDSVYAKPNTKIEQEGCVSPLTLFLLVVLNKEDDEEESWLLFSEVYFEKKEKHDESKCDLFKQLIKKGCNVNSMYLQLSSPNLNEIKENLQVPDVLLIAFLSTNENYVKMLIPYWWGPPLALLLLCTEFEDVEFWLPILIGRYGGVPRGMSLCHTLHTHLLQFEDCYIAYEDDEDNDEDWDAYLEEINPMSLQSLCKYAVRKCVAERVVPGDNLTDVLKDNLPPLLKSVVLH